MVSSRGLLALVVALGAAARGASFFAGPRRPAPRPGSAVRRAAADAAAEALETLWRAHSKPLLRVGAAGVKDTHRNSLRELLAAHGHVCVKVNGARGDAAAVAAAAAALQTASDDAAVVVTKGVLVLFGPAV